tara:strand:+ start:726 stop:944 length:219 start_codon:yes stop_codon:yes gene_type:complete
VIKEIAKKLVPLVDSKKSSDLLEVYMNYRVEELHKLLEQHEDIHNIAKAQGAIQEIRRLKTLRDEVLAKAEK